ncbi:MAG: hypothetical protein AAB263_15295, partial [Planctomycetota bacterium]
CPISLLTGLSRDEAATVYFLTNGLRSGGTVVELSQAAAAELPKIDWPRRPQIFKRELSEWIANLQVTVPSSSGAVKLIDLLLLAIDGASGRHEFKSTHVPEATPFSTPALAAPPVFKPPTVRTPLPGTTHVRATPVPPPPQSAAAQPVAHGEDPLSRLNELFPEEEGGGFMPGKEDISSILDRLLPDEQVGGSPGAAPSAGTSGGRRATEAGGGFSVFLAKITDDERRKKAVTLIAELGKVSVEEAEGLSKKMIIPVLRGVSKEDAEAAKAQFGKIGILARVKGPE